MKQNEVMRLRENCSFSIDNVADMASLQEDVESLFVKSLDSESPSPKLFISYLVTYFDNRPKIINIFSFWVKFKILLKKIKYIITIEIISKGIIFDVIKTTKDLYLFEVNKYLIPIYAFKDSIEDICRG